MRIKNKKNLELKFSDGFTLIEVMAAVAVLSIGLIGGLTAITKNLSIISGGEDRIIAANLAAEGIELVRNVRDTNWLQGAVDWKFNVEGYNPSNEAVKFFCADPATVYKITPLPLGIDDTTRCSGAGVDRPCQIYVYTKTADGSKCYSDNFGNQVGYSRVATGFFRFIKLTELSSDSVKAKVQIKWLEGSQYKYLTVEETLYNWK